MAILNRVFVSYIKNVLTKAVETKEPAYKNDPLVVLGERIRFSSFNSEKFSFLKFNKKQITDAADRYKQDGFIGIVSSYFSTGIENRFTDIKTERMILALKTGYCSLPGTTCSTILAGFNKDISTEKVLEIYASHGLSHNVKSLRETYDFNDINKRSGQLSILLDINKNKRENIKAVSNFNKRYETMRAYIYAEHGQREKIIRNSEMKRSLFFHYWKMFCRYGVLGIVINCKEVMTRTKVGLHNEARMVIDKLQHSDRQNIYYVRQMKTRGINIDTSTVSKILKRWKTTDFNSRFTDNLKRLENEEAFIIDNKTEELPTFKVERYVDEFYFAQLQGLKDHGINTDAPGLFVLWHYIDKLGIFPILEKMKLTKVKNNKGYSWFELLLLNIGRIFYGIQTYSATCKHPESTPAFFTGLIKTPCNDSFLDGLESKITEKQTVELRKILIKRATELKLFDMKQTALDFHQIDLDVIFGKLRKFGKSPSPKKKICYNGFRPHIAWDVKENCLIAAEFRKGSARGTTTAKPFIKQYLMNELNDVFENVYIDSEYTGKDLWSFILDSEKGMGANLTACLKQNAFVKKARDNFITENRNDDNFWNYFDDNHVFSNKTFDLNWELKRGGETISFFLNCVVKKNISTGKLRCFGTSAKSMTSAKILDDYSRRWTIENGIKDLVYSYFFDCCPGTRPHLADIHFLTVTICRYIYKMIELDINEDLKNQNNSTKTLYSMRNFLFRQGAGKIFYKNNTFIIKHLNAYTPVMTGMLKRLYNKIHEESKHGLQILGNSKLEFQLKHPHGEDFRNSMKKVPISSVKIF